MKSKILLLALFISCVQQNMFGQTNSNFYLHENGVTCMCPNAAVGESGTVNGVTYTKRTREQITEANAANTCTSGITDMSSLFAFKWNFNENISTWDLSSVTDMNTMFGDAMVFNQPIGNWDVSKVTNMSSLFSGARSFNQPIGSWDVSNVTNMIMMFYATPFNQPIGNWDVSSVTNMGSMFTGAESFNQPINTWHVSSVTDMSRMFKDAIVFNQPIDSWDVSKVTNMGDMFFTAESFNQPISSWDVSKVTNMSSMFNYATVFNQDISKWCVQNIRLDNSNSFSSVLEEKNTPKWGEDCTTLSNEDFENIKNQIIISPNPTTNQLTLTQTEPIKKASVYNYVGQLIITQKGTENTMQLNVSSLANGNYLVKIESDKESHTVRFVKE